ncbi:MAG: hypothetical protein ACFFBI_12020, partial [Promethearchaeota archaeon]
MPEIEKFEEISQKLENHEKRIVKLEEFILKGAENKKLRKKISVREYIMSKEPKNDVNMTLAIANYIEEYENLKFYNKKDLEKYFKKAKEIPPSNINDKVYQNIKKGYMMEADEKKDNLKSWCLTNSGMKFC